MSGSEIDFFKWFYQPNDQFDVDDVIRISKVYKIKGPLVFEKVVQYCVQVRKLDEQAIFKNFTNIQLVTFLSVKYKNSPPKNVTENTVSLIDRLMSVLMKTRTYEVFGLRSNFDGSHEQLLCRTDIAKDIHFGYPTVDPQLGRPHLNWKQCKFTGCTNMCFSYTEKWGKGDRKMLNEEAKLDTKIAKGTILDHPRVLDTKVEDHLSTKGLRRHLQQHKSFVPGLHLMHEKIVEQTELTPEKVLEYGLTSCPSVICNESERVFTPDELVDHFNALGIEPFWQKGETPKPPNMNIYSLEGESRSTFCFAEDMVCSYCNTNRSDIICNRCRTTKICWDCARQYIHYSYDNLQCKECQNLYDNYRMFAGMSDQDRARIRKNYASINFIPF